MAVRKHEPWIRLKQWPTPDWEYTNGLYRFIKSSFHGSVWRAARIQAKGLENIPREGGVLLAVNHFSWADPIVMGAVLERPAFYLAKERLFRNETVGRLLEGMGQIKVDREQRGNQDALKQAVEALEQGLIIGVFPEGTRSRQGEVKRGKTGIARIAARSNVPVIPIALTTDDFWPKSAGAPRFGEPVYVNVGEPMHFDLKPQDVEDRQRMRDVTDDIMERIRELLAEARVARERGESWS